MALQETKVWTCDVCGYQETAVSYPYYWRELFFAQRKNLFGFASYGDSMDVCGKCNGKVHHTTASRAEAVKEALLKLWRKMK
jgi:ribosomal protein L37AE/L43A